MNEITIADVPKEQWEDAIRIMRGKERRSSECEHEGKMHPLEGCEFCGEVIIRISRDLYNRLRKLEEFKPYKPSKDRIAGKFKNAKTGEIIKK